ncbi:MAG TPA: sugar phosphate isomerase/epimerase [Ktedonobacterales bacterium]|nr:sugar phosphate isomerase/epimerase [Ktedonobacterales bacterium]
MKLSFSTASFYHLPLRFTLGVARDLGFDGVELVVGPEYLLFGERRTRELLTSMGVTPLSLHPPLRRMPGWPINHVKNVLRAVEAARTFDCEVVVIHATDAWQEGNRRWREYAAAMKAAQAAEGPPITIAVEISQFTKRRWREAMDDVDTVLRFVEDQGEQVGITLDTAHTGANGDGLLELYAKVRPRLRNIHLSDWLLRGGDHHTHLVPGEGALPLAEFLGVLARDAYAGLVTLEVSPVHLHAWSLRQGRALLAESLDFVRANLSATEQRQHSVSLEESARSQQV